MTRPLSSPAAVRRLRAFRFSAPRLLPVALPVLVLAAALTLATPLRAAEPVYPTGVHVGLVPIAGLAPSDKFPGFEDRDADASVLVLEVVGPTPEQNAAQIGAERIRKQGITEDLRETLKLSTGEATLVAGRQEAEGTKVRKWILLAPIRDKASALIVVQAPPSSDAYTDASVKAMLASFVVRETVPVEEQLRLLPIRLGDLSGLRPVRVLGNSGAMLTDGPKDTADPTEQPLLIVTVGRGGPEERRARDVFARNLLAGFGGYKDVRIVNSELLRLGGGPADTHQLMAEGKDPKTDETIKIVQWLRFGSGAYVRLLGVAKDDAWRDAFPRFRAVRDGIAPKE